MADKGNTPLDAELSRRDALWRLLGLPVHIGLLSTGLAAQMKPPSNLRIAGSRPVDPNSPIAQGVYPRTLLTPGMLTALRARIVSDAAFKARWQTAVTQFEAAKGTWTTTPDDPLANAFAAFLAMVRRSNDNLGLSWKMPWQTYRDRIITSARGWSRSGRHEEKAIATAIIFDCLYNDLTAAERSDFVDLVEMGYKANGYLGIGNEVWDNGTSDDHAAKMLCALVSPTAAQRMTEAYERTIAIAETNDWMGFGFGLGREWHEGYTSRHGIPMLLYALKHAGGYSDAETIDYFLIHLRDAWQLTRHAIIPHPSTGVEGGTPWTSDKFHTQDPIKGFHRQMNVGAHMAWALAALPGKVNLNGSGMSDGPLANSEAAYFGYLRTVFDDVNPISPNQLRDVLDVTLMGGTTSTHTARFWAFPAWLIHNAKEYSAVSEADAGIPQVRRYWPGTLEWTFINSPDFSRDRGSVIRYTHRRYGASNYEEGTRQNGRWHVHRDGPLLIQRGETGHGVNTRRATYCANGTVSFIDQNLYPLFTFNAVDDGDYGGVRALRGDGATKDQILALGINADFGPVKSWHADAPYVAITSDLTASYNSSLVQVPPVASNERKISSFIREFVVVRRGADGTDREKVFTYDRIALLDAKFEPRYHLCPAANPNIDGVETEVLPWGPDQNDSNFDWYAKGPTHWDYANATRLIYDNRLEPRAPIPGNGKVCVTWLQPGGSGVKVRKAGGFNAVSKVEPRQSGHPFFSPWRGWSGKEEWAQLSGLEDRAYVGLYTVSVSPATVTLDTRFLIACEVMSASDTPGPAQSLPCDTSSVAARCGASVVVFGRNGDRPSGWVDVPAGVSLVVVVNRSGAAPRSIPVSSAGRVTF